MATRPDYLSPNDNFLEGNDLNDPRLLQMDMNALNNNVPDKMIDERFLQLANKYPFLQISPKLYQSKIGINAGVNKDFVVPDGVSMLRITALDLSYCSFYNTCPPADFSDRLGNGCLMLPAKTTTPLYFIDGVRVISFLSAVTTLICIEHGS